MFEITDGDPLNVFAINENSGLITTQKLLDREFKNFYNRQIQTHEKIDVVIHYPKLPEITTQ